MPKNTTVLQQALKDADLRIEGDKLPLRDRTVKTFQRFIAAIRAVEDQVQKEVTDLYDRLDKRATELDICRREHGQMQARVYQLENALKDANLKEKLGELDALTRTDREKLLEEQASYTHLPR